MRSVRFVERLEFEFHGNILKNAIALGDIDNDGHPELIVGNSNGDISVFKGEQCWQKISGLGMITTVGVGDVMNCGSKALVVICGDGWCHIYLCLQSKTEDTDDSATQGKLQPVHVQRIPANTKILLIGDIDNDGNEELVVGLTDRVVRSYRWAQSVTGGKLVCLNKWECARQIGSVTLNRGPNGVSCLIVAQPGGTFMRIQTEPQTLEKKLNVKDEKPQFAYVDYQLLASSKMRNQNISTEIIGSIEQGTDKLTGKSSPYAVATLDGTLMLVQDEQILWSIQVDHQLFALRKLDLTNDGRDEIVVCSWDGQTYILDQKKHCVRFQLEESVAVFCAGLYSLSPSSSPVPCLIYTTFTNKIYVYYNVQLPSLASKSLITLIQEKEELETLCGKEFLSDRRKLKSLIEWCLYGKRNDACSADGSNSSATLLA